MLAVAAVAVLALSVSACGGSKKSTTTTTGVPITAEWAGGVCSAFTEWKTSLEDVKSTVKGGDLSPSQLKQAVQQAEDATTTLARSLQQLGMPDAPGIEQAKTNLANLRSALTASVDVIKVSLNRGNTSTSELQTVGEQLDYMSGVLTRAAARLKQFEPSGELGKAFHDAPSCAEYF